jgi:Putative adhesin
MPTFTTPEPISVQIELPVGDTWIKASDRADTVVEVRPRNTSSKADVSAAEQTRVEYVDGQLLIKVPKSWRRYSMFSAGPSVDLVIELPSGSNLQADAEWASFRGEGRLGEVRLHSGGDDIRLAHTGPLDVDTSHGDVTVERVAGPARITTSSGSIRVREIDGPAEIKNSSGECWLGEVTGDVSVRSAHGDITIERAHAGVEARTAHGAILVGEVVRGTTVLQTSYGAIEVGIRKGTAAWLDVNSVNGAVRNSLEASDAPGETEETIEVRASTSYGPIMIRRA